MLDCWRYIWNKKGNYYLTLMPYLGVAHYIKCYIKRGDFTWLELYIFALSNPYLQILSIKSLTIEL